MKSEEPHKKAKKIISTREETHPSKNLQILHEMNKLILLEINRLTWCLAESVPSHREHR